MTKLRLKKGILFSEFTKRFRRNIKELNHKLFFKLHEQGLIKKPVARLEVSKKGLMVMDKLLLKFYHRCLEVIWLG